MTWESLVDVKDFKAYLFVINKNRAINALKKSLADFRRNEKICQWVPLNEQQGKNTKANEKDTVGSAALKDKSTALRRKSQPLRVQYIAKYPAAFSSILMLQGLFLVLPVDVLDKKFNALDEKYKSSQTAKDLGIIIQNN